MNDLENSVDALHTLRVSLLVIFFLPIIFLLEHFTMILSERGVVTGNEASVLDEQAAHLKNGSAGGGGSEGGGGGGSEAPRGGSASAAHLVTDEDLLCLVL